MRLNASTVIRAQPIHGGASILPGICLIPYTPEAVPLYHHWMLDPDLREATASELLTLDEEFDMQRKWQTDSDKITFLVAVSNNKRRRKGVEDIVSGGTADVASGVVDEGSRGDTGAGDAETDDVIDARDLAHLVGDINVFFEPLSAGASFDDDEETDQQPSANDRGEMMTVQLSESAREFASVLLSTQRPDKSEHGGSLQAECGDADADSVSQSVNADEATLKHALGIDDNPESGSRVDYSTGELSVQVADVSARGARVALRAVLLMMEYTALELGTRRFVARISASNAASLALFRKRLRFRDRREDGQPNVFGEVELFRNVSAPEDRALLLADLDAFVGPRRRFPFTPELQAAAAVHWTPKGE